MKLLVVSHKPCWRAAPGRFETDGGFPMQMRALAELFDETEVAVPVVPPRGGGAALDGAALRVLPLSPPRGRGPARKALLPAWLAFNLPRLVAAARKADAIHAAVPGDVGTVGMWLARLLRKPLFVRYCGNWLVARTPAERYWQRSMDRLAGGRNVMLATGGGPRPPSPRVGWIFATSLTNRDMEDAARAPRRPDPRAPRLITVGRQERGKGTAELLDALPVLRERFPGLSLDVVGGGSFLPELRVQATRLGVSDAATFHGQVPRDRVLALLRDADLFCFLTASEGFPKAVVEAMAVGLPVITTRVSVLPTLVEGGSGVIVPDTDAASVTAAVEMCLRDHAAMAERARATAGEYSLERWRDTIGVTLRDAWGALRSHAS
jgi:glycosyltransferase involved in cell wall biosynthesis